MSPFTLLSLPFFCSHNPSKSLMTVTRNRFSSLDGICQDIARLKDGQLQCMALASIRSPCDDSMKTSSCMEPEIDPIAQQRVFRFFQDHSLPFTWIRNIRYRWDFTALPIFYVCLVLLCFKRGFMEKGHAIMTFLLLWLRQRGVKG